MRHSFFALIALTSFGATLGAACSSSSSKGTPADAGVEAEASAGDLVEGCTTFVDRRDPSADRTLLWDQSIAVDDTRCMEIKVGQTVTWGNGAGGPGDFAQHPVVPFEGDDNNPIQNMNYQTGEVVFPTAGTFGYVCGTHPAMKGAVKVSAE